MPDVTREMVLEKLRTVRGPDMEGNIVDLGLVSDVFISDGKAYFSITVPAESSGARGHGCLWLLGAGRRRRAADQAAACGTIR